MPATSPEEIGAKAAAAVLTELFKECAKGATGWLREKAKERDFFGTAAEKYRQQIVDRFGTVKILGMTKPIPLDTIYTQINILEKISSRQRTTIQALEKQFCSDTRGFGCIQETKPGDEVLDKLTKFMLLGKPGAGKTTFLKHTAVRAATGGLKKNQIPIFIGLKDLTDSKNDLTTYITRQFDICHFPEAAPFIERALKLGKCIVLFDGLDEVSGSKLNKLVREIVAFSDKYTKNRFIISCRTAAYDYYFEKFTDVEVADFTKEQIDKFVSNWFHDDPTKAKLCTDKLNHDGAILELASVPLLLTLLCLAFEESLDFPPNRSELYEEAIDALLKKWDASRCIKRDDVYRHLSFRRKESLLSRIAANTFSREQYFFPKKTAEREIYDFIANLPEAKQETLAPDSQTILKSIEAQHGIIIERARNIYSFSHLTFQEYFTAKYFVDMYNNKEALSALIKKQIFNSHWCEVFLLIAGMLDKSDEYLLCIEEEINLAIFSDSILFNTIMEFWIFCREMPDTIPLGLKVMMQLYLLEVGKDRRYRPVVVPYLLNILELFLGKDISALSYDKEANTLSVSNSCAILEGSTYWVARGGDFESVPEVFIGATIPAFPRGTLPDKVNTDLLRKILYATQLLLQCLKTECYVSNDTRQRLLDGVLTGGYKP